jgi:YesN/AraC family two-component response regulator
MAEQWKDLMGYEGYYQVSNHGRVRSLDRAVPHARHGKINIKGKLMKKSRRPNGYEQVKLRQHGIKNYQARVHTLVLLMFEGLPPTTEHECNHKNGIRHDNHIKNLEWVTRSENMKHAYDILGKDAQKGGENGNSKLTKNSVLEIRKLHLTGNYTQQKLGKMFGISHVNVGSIVHRETWRHIP